MNARLLKAAALLGLCLALAPAPPAQAEDYSLSDEDWNGVGYLVTTGQEARVVVKTEATLDLGRLRPSDVLVWLYPQSPLPVDDLLNYVKEGGHMVLADDAGAGGAIFRALGLTRRPPAEAGEDQGLATRYADRHGLPMLTPPTDHFLFYNVERVVANHPALLFGAGEAVLPVGTDGAALIAEVTHGAGAVLAVGDPSLFLNAMMRRFYGNKQLAANVMRFYCLQDPCEVHLVLPETEIVGTYRSGLGRLGALPRVLDEAVTLINSAMRSVDGMVATPPWPIVLVLIMLFVAVLLARSLLVGVRPIVEPQGPRSTPGISPLRHDVAALVAGHEDADFAGPTAVLLAEVASGEVGRFAAHQGVASEGGGHRAAQEAVLRIRQEADSVQLAERGPVSAERFLALLRDVRAVSQYLESTPRWSEQPQGGASYKALHRDE